MVGVKRTSGALDEDEEQSDHSSEGSSANKRARHGPDASESGPSGPRNIGRNGTNGHGSRDDDEYVEEPHQPGSLVRVTLTNFVTYTAAEFHPGPSLNMVIGPNGTGKSTLVCAICLGLGWDPRNLGRAKEIGEFVKHGSTEAVIEIELAAAEQQPRNPVIRRVIRKEGNKSAFFINGRGASQKEVVALAKSFAIQIDNLCQFLPQDRVVEFAGLSPIALLRETLRAAAPDEMVQWHQELIDLRTEEKRLEIEQESEDAALKQLQNKQNATREDVERWHQRQDLVMRQRLLKACHPHIEMKVVRNQCTTLQGDTAQAQQELDQLQEDAAPAQTALLEMEAYRDEIQRVKTQRQVEVAQAKERATGLIASIKSAQDSITECDNQIEAEKKEERERRTELNRLAGTIATLERQMKEDPVVVNEAGYRERRSGLQERRVELGRSIKGLDSQFSDTKQHLGELKQKKTDLMEERTSLISEGGKAANSLRKLSSDTFQAWDWIQKNKHTLQLKGDIYGPPIITCSVSDPQYAALVESGLGLGDATAITLTNGEDQRLISNYLLGKDGLNLHQITLRSVCQSRDSYLAPLERDKLRALGFDGWLIDYIKGPDPVLAMLCDSANLHRTAYSVKSLTNEEHNKVERSVLSNWISGSKRHRLMRRKEYGDAAVSTRVTDVVAAKWFTDQPVDNERKEQLESALKEIEKEVEKLRERHDKAKEEKKAYAQKYTDAKAEMDELDNDFRARQKARAQWESLPGKIAEKQEEMEGIRESKRQTGSRILAIKAKSEKFALKAASFAVEYQKSVSEIRRAHESLVEAHIRLVEANSEVESLKDENTDINRTIATLKTKIEAQKIELRRLKQRLGELKEGARKVIETLSLEERRILHEYSQKPTLEDLNNEVEAVDNRLELMADGNPRAAREYESREQEIARKEALLAALVTQLETTREKITGIREQWEPRLDELVSTISDGFSHNFAQIGCAGQVGVYKDEDFEKWSIQIQVRFREHETLSILDSHRQSGGERAVSTIFYLMALQDLARSPFRVVDEINQGMDPRNERMVHERMVDIACREHTSQYFLITPKLLSGLKYHPKMKIHCIASGEHMPAKTGGLDFHRLADVALRRRMGTLRR